MTKQLLDNNKTGDCKYCKCKKCENTSCAKQSCKSCEVKGEKSNRTNCFIVKGEKK